MNLNPNDKHHVWALGFLLASIIPAAAAIQIAGFDPLTNNRFANDGSFVASQFDLSGVGLNGRWATMISENVYVTAEHFAPDVGSDMTFYASNDPGGTSVTRSITGTREQIQGTDIFVGTLDAALPSGFSFFDFATEDISGASGGPGSFSDSSYSGANAYVFGRSPSDLPNSQDMAVGRNVLNGFATGQTDGANTGDVVTATDDTDTADAVTFEAQLQTGDSGGPLFVENSEGGLTIVGTNWFIGTNGSGDDIFGASYLGNYDEDIQNFIDLNTVPEPSSFALLLSFTCGLVALRRRSGCKS